MILQVNKTPLHDAVNQWKIRTIKFLVEEVSMDISKFDEVHNIIFCGHM